ncbi:hypothetical protein [Pseudonocardia sp. GCM10023141]|uniref:hypothetical protein n=1 Tax=Pseudonocardia sp. GCM10023141 TaxID=3252653 RepID=UPI00360F720A
MTDTLVSARRLASIACCFAVLAAPVAVAGLVTPAPAASVAAGPDGPDPVGQCWWTHACGGGHPWIQ